MVIFIIIPRGLHCAAPILGKSIVWPGSNTLVPGKNFKLFGLGVSCVCMNMVRQTHVFKMGTFLLTFLCTACDSPLKCFTEFWLQVKNDIII